MAKNVTNGKNEINHLNPSLFNDQYLDKVINDIAYDSDDISWYVKGLLWDLVMQLRTDLK